MLKHRHILAYLISALISLQALAAVAVPCALSPDAGESVMASAEAEPHHAHHGSGDAGGPASDDTNSCCDVGYCSQGGCYSIAAAANDELPPLARRLHSPSAVDLTSAPVHTPDPLFRPPSS